MAEIFESKQVVRLGRARDGSRFACQFRSPTTKSEAIVLKHWHRNLLPALSYRSVIVVEGPHDFAALHALAIRLFKEIGEFLPATRGVCIISAGATGDGGYMNVLRLANAARQMGLRAVGVVDGDTNEDVMPLKLETYLLMHRILLSKVRRSGQFHILALNPSDKTNFALGRLCRRFILLSLDCLGASPLSILVKYRIPALQASWREFQVNVMSLAVGVKS